MLFVPLSGITPASIQQTIQVKCMKEILPGNYLVGDTTASAVLVATPQQIISLQEGHWYRMANVRAVMVAGFLRLVSDPWMVEILEPGDPVVDQTAVLTPNLSQTEFVQVFLPR
ncbi:hypothetical protein HDV03_002288 [Kappamyces sp. JEL0829]|nr:hypothetical protein HDV03_002288 [Kappamyces sp. JEL0829]